MDTGTLLAFGLYVTRTSSLVLVAPIFGEGLGLGAYKVALIVILSLLLFAVTGPALPGAVPPLLYGAMVLRELLIGVTLAMVLQIALLAVRVSGELIGNEMAFSIANVTDPVTGVNTPLVTRIYETVFLLGFLAVDGHHLVIRALGDSFTRASVGEVRLASGAVGLVRGLFGDMFAAGISFAAPVLIVLLLVSVLIGLLARVVPHLNIIEVGFTLRILLGLLALYLFAPLLGPALKGLYEQFAHNMDAALAALER